VYLSARGHLKENKHLKILLNQTVTRIITEDGRATAVEYQSSTPLGEDGGAIHSIRSRKQIILSAGALGSPGILERSGIGSPEILTPLGIEVVSDLPGVGNKYWDHQVRVSTYNCHQFSTHARHIIVDHTEQVLVHHNKLSCS
jgi:alcohol oxidase